MNKDINAAIRKLTKQGWTADRLSKHVRLTSPAGESITVSFTPGDVRAIANVMADIRRMSQC